MINALEAGDGRVTIIDQSRLPLEEIRLEIRTVQEMAEAITEMKLRGAPLIGVAAAYGMVLALNGSASGPAEMEALYDLSEMLLASTRPTAVNLFWALARMRESFNEVRGSDLETIRSHLRVAADRLYREDIDVNMAIGVNGSTLFEGAVEIMTICNAGALATCGYGTALGVIRRLHQEGRISNVWVCETRPVLQGARLTTWELHQDGIPYTLITDSMAAQVMKSHSVAGVIAGADRVAANGDTANKIGTLGLSILAAHYGIPFYVAAPLSTVDMKVDNGGGITIEERRGDEIRVVNGRHITVPGSPVYNPAFDVAPNQHISAIITEKGIARNPYFDSFQALFAGA